MGNIRSVYNAFKYLKAEVDVVENPQKLELEKSLLVIPGVGAFKDGIKNLQPFIPKIFEAIDLGVPVLGICIGFQMFFEESEESKNVKGLGLIKGKVVKIKTKLKLPHIGWNRLEIVKPNCPIFRGIEDGYVYFAHSYHAIPEDKNVIAAKTEYGCDVTAAVWKDNLYGVQFHPEKSGRIGLKILKNFLGLEVNHAL